MIAEWIVHFLLLLPFFPSIQSADSRSSAKLSTTWNATFRSENLLVSTQILSQKISNSTEMPAICFGFIYKDDGYILVISPRINCSMNDNPELILWSPNRDSPVTKDATLQFNSLGDLVLREANGRIIWSTNTSGKSVVGMRITATGGLLLYTKNNENVWKSFDEEPASHIWLPGRKLELDRTIDADEGVFYISLEEAGLCAFIDSDYYDSYPRQRYRKYFTPEKSTSPKNVSNSIPFKIGSLNFNDDVGPPSVDYISVGGSPFQYMRMENDGHLRVYQWVRAEESVVDDILTIGYSNCSYPTVCGSYGICSNGECTCPIERGGGSSYFKPLNSRQPKKGCLEKTALSCNSSDVHLIEVEDVTYIGFEAVMENTDIDTCKKACLDNCSCKAALFRSYEDVSLGDCSLPSQLFSFMRKSEYNLDYNPTTFLKVQNASLAASPTSSTRRNEDQNNASRYSTILGIVFGIIFFVVLVGVSFYVIRNRLCKKEVTRENHLPFEGDDNMDEASDMPKKFSYEELRSATGDFHKKIGRGGFGSVYEGILGDETIAVKCLDLNKGQSQGRKQFLAEVKTIGSIHHVNLVKLVGFCGEKSHKLLAYEYMRNGSLDKWIFHEDLTLDWQTRRKIILDIARGLLYLHMECQKKIIHLDIKPENILLDDNCNAKISDFGLARLFEKDESHVLTMMRGTRGYLAPEWFLNRRITEKVDVYSFGVVVLETVCGRRNLDYSQPEENECLLHVVKRKIEEDTLYDILDKRNEDIQQHKEEAIKMIRTAIWCLQGDCTNRPSMSKVVKVLEGVMDMESISDYSFLTLAPMFVPKEITASTSTPLTESKLSGPR